MNPFDVLTFGETMVRLTPPNHLLLEQSKSLDVEIGGSESNTAVGLSRLGIQTAWLSGLPRNPLGRMVAATLERHGVDTSHVVWQEDGRCGLYFFEEGAPPRGSRVLYDRAGSVFSQLTADALPNDLFSSSSPKHLHLSGITLALGNPVRQAARHLFEQALAADWTVSFDFNYRSSLWTMGEATAVCQPFLAQSTLCFLPLRDATASLHMQTDSSIDLVLEALSNQFPATIFVLTLGKDGAAALVPGETAVYQPAIPMQPVSRLGAGDAFDAGVLYGFLTTQGSMVERVTTGLRWGVAMAAMKYTIVGDLPLVEKTAVQQLVESGQINTLNR